MVHDGKLTAIGDFEVMQLTVIVDAVDGAAAGPAVAAATAAGGKRRATYVRRCLCLACSAAVGAKTLPFLCGPQVRLDISRIIGEEEIAGDNVPSPSANRLREAFSSNPAAAGVHTAFALRFHCLCGCDTALLG